MYDRSKRYIFTVLLLYGNNYNYTFRCCFFNKIRCAKKIKNLYSRWRGICYYYSTWGQPGLPALARTQASILRWWVQNTPPSQGPKHEIFLHKSGLYG